ncbi:hypothetical protein Trydic_g7711 [Trypoxylus dichotomus]
MGKIADGIIRTRLQQETDDLDVIPNCQFAFHRGHSTTQQVMRIVEQTKEGFNLRKYTGAVFLDVAKAFDKVWHQGLLLKMHRVGISKTMIRLVHPYLRKRQFKVNLEGQQSTVRTATAGVLPGMESGESPSVQGKVWPCFSREAVTEEESTACQPNLPSKEVSFPGDLRSNTWRYYWILE